MAGGCRRTRCRRCVRVGAGGTDQGFITAVVVASAASGGHHQDHKYACQTDFHNATRGCVFLDPHKEPGAAALTAPVCDADVANRHARCKALTMLKFGGLKGSGGRCMGRSHNFGGRTSKEETMRRMKLECWGPPVRFQGVRHTWDRWHTPLAAIGLGVLVVFATMVLV